MKLSLDFITADPNQPRTEFDAAELEVLANSIASNGLMQPITVRPAKEEGRYWIVAGERRYRAHQILRSRGLKQFASIECMVKKPPSHADLRIRQIVENVCRADLTPLEEARSYKDLVDTGMGTIEIAKRLGVRSDRVDSRLSLLNLAPTLTSLLESNQLSQPNAYELARLPNHSDQTKLLQMLNRGELGKWKSLRAAVDAILDGEKQRDMFGGKAATDEEAETLTAMERKIEAVANSLAGGWKNGECVIATKVSPDRAARMADKLQAIRMSIRHMESALRTVTAQHKIVMGG
jgi:ParB family transcriptional regulator, chromosome partitioning protein